MPLMLGDAGRELWQLRHLVPGGSGILGTRLREQPQAAVPAVRGLVVHHLVDALGGQAESSAGGMARLRPRCPATGLFTDRRWGVRRIGRRRQGRIARMPAEQFAQDAHLCFQLGNAAPEHPALWTARGHPPTLDDSRLFSCANSAIKR